MNTKKQKMLKEIANLENQLKDWTGEPFSWGPITISKVAEDLIQVSSKIGDICFNTERAVAEFVLLNLQLFSDRSED
jgi:hypothetical protein